MTTKNEEIRTASVYNNCIGKLHIGINNGTACGRTMCANLLHTDLVAWIRKEVKTNELVEKYFYFENGIVKYTNPK